MRGILVDIADEVLGNRLGIEVSHLGYPWKRAQQMVRENKADAFITVSTQERLSYTVSGNEPAIVFSVHLLTRKGSDRIQDLERVKTIEELKNYKVVDYLGNSWSERKLKNMEVYWLSNIDAIFPFLTLGRADVALASNRTLYRMKQEGYASKLVILPNTLDSVSFYFCVGIRSQYKGIIADIDKTLREMHSDGTIDRIVERYYN